MRDIKFAKLARISLLPMVAAGLSMGIQAQTSTGSDKQPATAATSQAKPAQAANYRGLRASQMIGMSVRNEKGENIGQIDDMIVNLNTGDVRYAVLRFDPGIFQGERLFAVPTTQLRMAPDRNDLVYQMSRQKLERAAINRSEWNERYLDDPQRVAALDRTWGLSQPARGARVHRASDLIGKDVNSRTGESIGEIEELVVNMPRQRVHYAVMKFDPGWAGAEKRVVLPLRSFGLTADRDEFVLNVDKSKVQAMKDFNDARYANLNDATLVAEVDRYFNTQLPTLVGSASTAGSSPDTRAAGAGPDSRATRAGAAGGGIMQPRQDRN